MSTDLHLAEAFQYDLILGAARVGALTDCITKLQVKYNTYFSFKTSRNSSLLHLYNTRGHHSNALTTIKIQISSIILAPRNLSSSKENNESKIFYLAKLLSAIYFEYLLSTYCPLFLALLCCL